MDYRDEETQKFKVPSQVIDARRVLEEVYAALKEKGYRPIDQLVGYLISGDPTYITAHRNARSIIRKVERDDLLTEVLRFYLGEAEGGAADRG